MIIKQFANGFWYVIDVKTNQTLAIKMTKQEAISRCREENWTVENEKDVKAA